MSSPTDESCGTKSRCKCCCVIYAVAHIAILTCISMALWKTAWAVEALAAGCRVGEQSSPTKQSVAHLTASPLFQGVGC